MLAVAALFLTMQLLAVAALFLTMQFAAVPGGARADGRLIDPVLYDLFLKELYDGSIRFGRVLPKWNKAYYDAGRHKYWAIGEGGTIAYSVDGGKYWLLAKTDTNENLNDILVLPYGVMPFDYSGPNAWVIGDNGTFLTSHDFGRSWRRGARVLVLDSVAVGKTKGLRLERLEFWKKSRHAYAMAKNAAYRLERDGRSWSDVPLPQTADDGLVTALVEVGENEEGYPPSLADACHVMAPGGDNSVKILHAGGEVIFEFGYSSHGVRLSGTDEERKCPDQGDDQEPYLLRENGNGDLDRVHYDKLKEAAGLSTRAKIRHAYQETETSPGVILTDDDAIYVQRAGTGGEWERIVPLAFEPLDVGEENAGGNANGSYNTVSAPSDLDRIWAVGNERLHVFDRFGFPQGRPSNINPVAGKMLRHADPGDDGNAVWVVGDRGLLLMAYSSVSRVVEIDTISDGNFQSIAYSDAGRGGIIVGSSGVLYFKVAGDIPAPAEAVTYDCEAFLKQMWRWLALPDPVGAAALKIRNDCGKS